MKTLTFFSTKLTAIGAIGLPLVFGCVALNAQTQAPIVQPGANPNPAPIIVEGHAASANAPAPYGVGDVLKLVHGNVSEDIIVTYIQNSGTVYNLTPQDLVSLREAGVPDRVVNAMLEQRKRVIETAGAVPQGPATAPYPYQAPAPAQAPLTPGEQGQGPVSTAYTVPYTPSYYDPGYYGYGYGYPYYYPYYGAYWPFYIGASFGPYCYGRGYCGYYGHGYYGHGYYGHGGYYGGGIHVVPHSGGGFHGGGGGIHVASSGFHMGGGGFHGGGGGGFHGGGGGGHR